jgi:predicted MFS family arabinose efflux permease
MINSFCLLLYTIGSICRTQKIILAKDIKWYASLTMKKLVFNAEDRHVKLMQWAFIGTRLMATPCWCLLSMLAFILYKNMHLSPLQIALIVALKPATSLLSPYWSQAIYQRPDKIVANLIGANFFRHLPFLCIPWVTSAWFIIFSFGFYMMLTRAMIPAWMELFKYNLPETKREQVVGYWTTIDYLGAASMAFGIGFLLDHYQQMWKWLFAFTAGLGMVSTFFLMIPSLARATRSVKAPDVSTLKMKEKIFKPWQRVWHLLRHRKDFTLFQIGFMLSGAGLMIMQPAFPQFFIDVLQLSFVELGLAIALCKGIGVALTSPLWTRLFRKINIFQLSALVTFFATLFPFLLLATSFHLLLLYIAYGFYGIMQAGSELSWHMSGLVFAQKEDSSTFSVINVLTVGVRGCIIPALGSILLLHIQPVGVILLGAFLCLFASGYFLFTSRTKINTVLPEKS